MSFDESVVLRKLGLTRAAPELQQRMIIRVRQLAAQRLQHRMQAEMTDEDYKKLTDITDDDEADAWLACRFPDYRRWFEEELGVTVDFVAAHAATVSATGRLAQ